MSAKSSLKDREGEAGAVIVEATITIFVFLLLLFGVVEFSYIYYQWNSLTMATQRGARLAAVSNPVAYNLTKLTGLEPANNLPGSTMPAFDCTCNGRTETCTGTVPTNAQACTWEKLNPVNYSRDALNTILLGRGNNGTSCVQGLNNAGMCQFFPGLTRANIVVRYQYTGMGYAGRTAGPVPTITVSLQDVSYNFILLSGLAGLTSVSFPARATSTITGEDLKATWSSS